MSSDFALEKLARLADTVSEADRTPELRLLLSFADYSRAAEEQLRAVGQRRTKGAALPDLLAAPETFQGLARFVRAVALGAEGAGVGLCSAEVLTLLKESLLHPLVQRETDGSYQAHRPAVVCPKPSPLNILQLLASGVFLFVTGNPEPAIAMLSAALSGVWPPCRAMQRRLVSRQFVPTADGGGDEGLARSSAGAAAATDAASSSKEARGGATGAAGRAEGAAGGSTVGASSGGAEQGKPAAAAGAAAAAAKEAQQDARPTDLAAALGKALAQHCPEISLGDMHKSALVLRLFLGCRAVGEQRGDGPGLQAVVRTLLMDCQQLLDLDPACAHAYVWAAQLALAARWPVERQRLRGLFEEGLCHARESCCWLAAGEVAHDYAVWLVSAAAGERNVAEKQAALLEAGKLLEGVQEAEGRLEPWLPPGRLVQLSARRQQLGALLQQLHRGRTAALGSARPAAGAGAANVCAFCGTPAAQLRLCGSCQAVGYCGRECQVKDWKAGHKAVCSGAAASSAAEEQPAAEAKGPGQ